MQADLKDLEMNVHTRDEDLDVKQIYVQCVADGSENDESSTATPTPSSGGNEAHSIDPSVLFGMERTFFSVAGGAGFVITMFGYGLMMVDPEQFDLFYVQGLVLVAFGLVFILFSWLVHLCRLRSLSRSPKLHGRSIHVSATWTGGLLLLLLMCSASELHYAREHPYMKRSMPVDVNNPESSLVPQPCHTTTRLPAIEPQPQGHHQQGGSRRLAQDAGTILI